MTKNRLQFSLIIVSIIAMFICSCSPKSRTKKDTQQDSANTQSNTPSINVDSMAATIDTTSYTNTSRYNEEDENMDKDEDYEDYDDDDAEDEYDDPFSQKTRHATATYYRYDGLGGKRRIDVDVDVDVQNGRVTRVHFPDNGVYPSGTDLTGGYLENGKTHVTNDMGNDYDITIR